MQFYRMPHDHPFWFGKCKHCPAASDIEQALVWFILYIGVIGGSIVGLLLLAEDGIKAVVK